MQWPSIYTYICTNIIYKVVMLYMKLMNTLWAVGKSNILVLNRSKEETGEPIPPWIRWVVLWLTWQWGALLAAQAAWPHSHHSSPFLLHKQIQNCGGGRGRNKRHSQYRDSTTVTTGQICVFWRQNSSCAKSVIMPMFKLNILSIPLISH